MYGIKNFNDKYYLFKSVEEYKEFEKNETAPSFVFCAKDITNERKSKSSLIDGSTKKLSNITIKTPAKNVYFKQDDIVVNIKTGMKWRISEIELDESNKQKQYSYMPDSYTILVLKG